MSSHLKGNWGRPLKLEPHFERRPTCWLYCVSQINVLQRQNPFSFFCGPDEPTLSMKGGPDLNGALAASLKEQKVPDSSPTWAEIISKLYIYNMIYHLWSSNVVSRLLLHALVCIYIYIYTVCLWRATGQCWGRVLLNRLPLGRWLGLYWCVCMFHAIGCGKGSEFPFWLHIRI